MRNWTQLEDNSLMALVNRGTPWAPIASHFHTTEETVKERFKYLDKCQELDEIKSGEVDVYV